MSGTGNLLLSFVNASGGPVDDQVTVSLKHFRLSQQLRQDNFSTQKSLNITGLIATHTGVFTLEIEAHKHRMIRQFVTIPMDQTLPFTAKLFIDSAKIARVQFPPFNALADDLKKALDNSLVGGKQGADLYARLQTDRAPLAGLLNLYNKMKRTKTLTGSDTFSFVEAFIQFEQDRFFVKVKPDFRKVMSDSSEADLFDAVPNSLHHPDLGFELAESYKSKDDFGNLQVTFSTNAAGEVRADVDIDESSGLDHFFIVIEHGATGGKTDPFFVNQLLLDQGIDPGYEIFV